MHVLLAICLLLLVGFCYTQEEYNFYVGEPLDYSKLGDKTIEEIENFPKRTEDGKLLEALVCFAEIICNIESDLRRNLTTCYEKAERDISVFEEESKTFCDKERPSQYDYLWDNYLKYMYLCDHDDKEYCGDDIKGPYDCIIDVKVELFDRRGAKCEINGNYSSWL